MGLLDAYQQQLDQGSMNPDAEQASVVTQLDSIGKALGHRAPWQPAGRRSGWQRFFRSQTAIPQVPGLYLWGGVGRGKTHLCDLFFEHLSFDDKVRLHFHRFMQRIHTDLRELGNVEDPLLTIADNWAARARLLLLDEIHVHDITDAMLLGGLLTALFERRVTLVTTSNVPPSDLYKDGLQRARFLPAIAQIEAHTQVLEMTGVTDYRLRVLQKEATYFEMPAGSNAERDVAATMQAQFARLVPGGSRRATQVDILGRKLPVLACSDDVVWFEFATLCDTPRSTHDYIDLATRFSTIMISNIPVLDDQRNDAARRLVNLVDEFYDRGVKLILSAAAAPDAIYRGKRLDFEFQRAASRLIEMQTTEYLGRPRQLR